MKLWSRLIQKLVLVLQLVTLHIFLLVQLGEGSPQSSTSLWHKPFVCIFYIMYWLLMALSAVQLRFDVRVTKGGVVLTHSVNVVVRAAYKVYRIIPFLDEIRVIADWTATDTSLDLFQAFKLEDMQQNLYEVKYDFDYRRTRPKGVSLLCARLQA